MTIADAPDVLTMADLARLLRCSIRTIARRRADGGYGLPPEMPSPDRRPRWARAVVETWMQQTAASAAFQRAVNRRWGR